jgi:elongation factor G
MGDAIGDLSARRGKISKIEPRANSTIIHAEVPLGTMFGYATALRSLTKGRASYSMEPLNFQKVPENIAAELLDQNSSTSKTGSQKK